MFHSVCLSQISYEVIIMRYYHPQFKDKETEIWRTEDEMIRNKGSELVSE